MGALDNAIELSLEEGKARLDAIMKRFLANRQILAVLLMLRHKGYFIRATR